MEVFLCNALPQLEVLSFHSSCATGLLGASSQRRPWVHRSQKAHRSKGPQEACTSLQIPDPGAIEFLVPPKPMRVFFQTAGCHLSDQQCLPSGLDKVPQKASTVSSETLHCA